MLRTNKDKVVMQSVQGKIHHPSFPASPYRLSHEGESLVVPATGGICYNVKIGDCAFKLAGDHIEPGVSIRNENERENSALNSLSCIGNKAKVVSGDGKGSVGYVTGKHGGVEHVLINFKKDDLENLAIDDKILIKAYGQGLKLLDYEDIHVMNIDPELLERLPIIEKEGKLIIKVAAIIPPYLMGSGIGAGSAYKGDYDIMTADMDEIKKHGIDKLKFGDLVLLADCDNTYGRGYLTGAVSVGVVIHSDCIKMGHGPGVTTILTSKKPLIKGVISEDSNIKDYM